MVLSKKVLIEFLQPKFFCFSTRQWMNKIEFKQLIVGKKRGLSATREICLAVFNRRLSFSAGYYSAPIFVCLQFKEFELYWGAVFFFLRSVHTFSWFLKSNWSSDFGHAETGNGAKKRVVLLREFFFALILK